MMCDDYEPPRYDDPGRILFRILGPYDGSVYRAEYEILDYEGGACAIIHEGTGFEWWLDRILEDLTPGIYVISGITGTYIRGDWSWGEDDDEEWEFESRRFATLKETLFEVLD